MSFSYRKNFRIVIKSNNTVCLVTMFIIIIYMLNFVISERAEKIKMHVYDMILVLVRFLLYDSDCFDIFKKVSNNIQLTMWRGNKIIKPLRSLLLHRTMSIGSKSHPILTGTTLTT
jgi:hypothetical protein